MELEVSDKQVGLNDETDKEADYEQSENDINFGLFGFEDTFNKEGDDLIKGKANIYLVKEVNEWMYR